MSKLDVSAIVAMAANRTIGKDNDIPWKGMVKGEQALFRLFTEGTVVIMGRRTWESLPKKFRPLPNRFNVVVTSQPLMDQPHMSVTSLENGLLLAAAMRDYDRAVLIGGQRIYEEGLKYCSTLYISKLDAIFPGDTFFPEISDHEWRLYNKQSFEDSPITYSMNIYKRKNDHVEVRESVL